MRFEPALILLRAGNRQMRTGYQTRQRKQAAWSKLLVHYTSVDFLQEVIRLVLRGIRIRGGFQGPVGAVMHERQEDVHTGPVDQLSVAVLADRRTLGEGFFRRVSFEILEVILVDQEHEREMRVAQVAID